MLEKLLTYMMLVTNLMGVPMLYQNTLAIHGCGTVSVSVVGLMEVSVTLILIQVWCYPIYVGKQFYLLKLQS